MNGPVPEWMIDVVKGNNSRFSEAKIDHSQITYQEKVDQKRQMMQSREVYIHGVKDELRKEGRMGSVAYVGEYKKTEVRN